MSIPRSRRSLLLSLAAVAAGLFCLANPAKAQADDTFAAIAYSPSTGHYGYGYNYNNLNDARTQALVKCNAEDAQVVIWAKNGWVALAVSDNGPYGYGWGTSQAIADSIALQYVHDRNGQNPRIVVSVNSGG